MSKFSLAAELSWLGSELTDAEVFRLYIYEVLLPVLWPGAVVVIDNLSAP